MDDAGCSLQTQAAASPPCTTSTTTGCVPTLAARASCGRNYRSITDRLLINCCSSWRTGDGVHSYFIVNTRSKRNHCAPQSVGCQQTGSADIQKPEISYRLIIVYHAAFGVARGQQQTDQ